MSKILFYLIVKPLSLLPLSITYLFSDFLFYLNFYVVGYRKGVVIDNLTKSFPEKSKAEINAIARAFFQHFCDMIVEGIRVFSMPERELLQRAKLKNPELIKKYFDQGKSIIIIAGHYSNWELAATACDLQIPHQTIGIYKPLRNKFIDSKVQESRSRFGMQMLAIRGVRKNFEANKDKLTATIFASDQSPSNTRAAHWMTFLNQDTAVMTGAEKMAKAYNLPVIFGSVTRPKRGYYEFEFTSLLDEPLNTEKGEITEIHTRFLEEKINDQAHYWLWTHKRWKHKRQEK